VRRPRDRRLATASRGAGVDGQDKPGHDGKGTPRRRRAADAPVNERLQRGRDDDDEAEGELGGERVDAGRHDAGVDMAPMTSGTSAPASEPERLVPDPRGGRLLRDNQVSRRPAARSESRRRSAAGRR